MKIFLEIRSDDGGCRKILESGFVVPVIDLAGIIGSIIGYPTTLGVGIDVGGLVQKSPSFIFRPEIDTILGIQFQKVAGLKIGIEVLYDIDFITEAAGVFLVIERVAAIHADRACRQVVRKGAVRQPGGQAEKRRSIQETVYAAAAAGRAGA